LWKVYTTYRTAFGRAPNLWHPTTFNEQLQKSKLFCRRRIHTQWADKIAVRDYVAAKIGAQYLTRLLWVGTCLDDARKLALPRRFLIKANQGSGTNIVVQDSTALDWNAAGQVAETWLARDHSVGFAEWQYRWIKPRLLIEEFLGASDGSVPLDYKFFCFDGRVELVQVDFDRFTEHTRSLYDRNFNLLPVGLEYPRHDGRVRPPTSFERMVQIAERLSEGAPFVRVDLFDIGRPVFGELTLHPGAGLEAFDPEEWDMKLGQVAR